MFNIFVKILNSRNTRERRISFRFHFKVNYATFVQCNRLNLNNYLYKRKIQIFKIANTSTINQFFLDKLKYKILKHLDLN